MNPTVESVQAAFDGLGGVDGLVAWVKDGGDDARKIFYTQIWLKILPLQVKATGEQDDQVVEVRWTVHDFRREDLPAVRTAA